MEKKKQQRGSKEGYNPGSGGKVVAAKQGSLRALWVKIGESGWRRKKLADGKKRTVKRFKVRDYK